MTKAKLRQFADLVIRWSSRINLVSKHDIPHLWLRHIQDSLELIPYIPAGTDYAIDLGSGAGFPGLVLCIATGIPFTLIESDRRKAAFLMDAARELSAPAKILCTRIEAAKTVPAMLVTARALAPLDKLLGLALPHLAENGVCLFPKGKNAPQELAEAGRLWQMEVEPFPSRLDPDACILRLGKIHHAGHSGPT